jgi:DNA (cytosine-5)-methyltransferase 1
LNVFDNASETRATVLIMYSFDSLSSNSMKSKNPNSGCNQVTICKTIDTAALNPSANQGGIAIVAENYLIIDGTRVNDVRVYEDGIVPTVVARYGTGGGNVPMIFSHTQGLDIQASEENSPTLRTGGAGMAVVYPIQNTVIGRADENGPGCKGYKDDGEPMFTVDTTSPHAVAVSPKVIGTLQARDYKGLNHEGARDGKAIIGNQTVRRLTPVECERLQGFPDDWTSGQADSNRYKQMGNAVAVPVVEWIVSRLVAQLDE